MTSKEPHTPMAIHIQTDVFMLPILFNISEETFTYNNVRLEIRTDNRRQGPVKVCSIYDQNKDDLLLTFDME